MAPQAPSETSAEWSPTQPAEAGEPAAAAGGAANILKIPVTVQAVLGTATMPVSKLMKLGRGAVVPLDQRMGEPVAIVVNGRLVARGEVVVLEEDNGQLGISITEIVNPSSGDSEG